MTTLILAAIAVAAVTGGFIGYRIGQWRERVRPTRRRPGNKSGR